jgi:AcrR family transcriptional regulator
MSATEQRTPTRERIVNAAAGLFQRQGYTGTGVKQIVVEAQAPFGSLYHFFPGGKEQLGAEVVRTAGGFFAQVVAEAMEPAANPVDAVRDAFAGAAETLRSTDYADACPIATVALEVASTNEPLREATAEVFESWIVALAGGFVEAGVGETAARELAISFLAGLEGAFVLCRAMRTTEPLIIAGETVAREVDAVLSAAGGR